MTMITTVRAALQAIASDGLSTRGLFQLGSAMGPANLYLAEVEGPDGFEPVRRSDSAGRTWLIAYTAPQPSRRTEADEPATRFRELTGAALLRLANPSAHCLVLEAGLPLEIRIPPRATQSLLVAAGYTEALFSRIAVASPFSPRRPVAPVAARRATVRLAS